MIPVHPISHTNKYPLISSIESAMTPLLIQLMERMLPIPSITIIRIMILITITKKYHKKKNLHTNFDQS